MLPTLSCRSSGPAGGSLIVVTAVTVVEVVVVAVEPEPPVAVPLHAAVFGTALVVLRFDLHWVLAVAVIEMVCGVLLVPNV
jgi:hypothetical protein